MQRAVREFRFAVRVDPMNDAAKANLELMLQNVRRRIRRARAAWWRQRSRQWRRGPGSTRSRLLTTLAVSFAFLTPFGFLFALASLIPIVAFLASIRRAK